MNQNPVIIPGTAGGSHVVDGPLTTVAAREASPALLRSAVDSRIVQVRPMSTPVDQISRMIGARPAQSMIVEYYSVDTKPVSAKLLAVPLGTGTAYDSKVVFTIKTSCDSMFAPTETLLVPSFKGSMKASVEGGGLVLYVIEADKNGGGLKVIALNYDGDESDGGIPSISVDSDVVRMGRAASELDVQTAQFEALPVKDFNYCQIFK